jgi:cytochrome c-type biogenesis protein CcmH/NrfF
MRLLALALVLAVGLCTTALAAAAPSFQEIEESLTCQCGCGLTVHACNHLQCPSAIPLRQEIREQMGLGLDRDQVLAHFEQKYGEKILSAPTTQGFNLAAWIMPFIVLAAGGVLVVFTLRRWRRAGERPSPRAPVTGVPTAGEISAHERTLERELERFDG